MTYRKYSGSAWTHFISIPLNISNGLTDKYKEFMRQAKGIDHNAFTKVNRLHLTACMLRLDGKDIDKMKDMLKRLTHYLKVELELGGLNVMKGSREDARVVYASVVNEQVLKSFEDALRRELASYNTSDLAQVKWHCTLINGKYTGRGYDTSELPEIEFGVVRPVELHLSRLKPSREPYYECECKAEIE